MVRVSRQGYAFENNSAHSISYITKARRWEAEFFIPEGKQPRRFPRKHAEQSTAKEYVDVLRFNGTVGSGTLKYFKVFFNVFTIDEVENSSGWKSMVLITSATKSLRHDWLRMLRVENYL